MVLVEQSWLDVLVQTGDAWHVYPEADSETPRGCTILSRTEGFDTGNKMLTKPLSLCKLGI